MPHFANSNKITYLLKIKIHLWSSLKPWLHCKILTYDYLTQQIYHTPGNVSVSSKHILSIFDDGNRVIFPITPAVKGTGSEAVSEGAVTQQPLRVQSNSRLQELLMAALVKCISTYYSRRQ